MGFAEGSEDSAPLRDDDGKDSRKKACRYAIDMPVRQLLVRLAVTPTLNDRREPLPPTLLGHCESLLEPTNTTYLERLARLNDALAADIDGAVTYITEPGPTASYYLGAFSSADWWLSERPFLIAITQTAGDAARGSIPRVTLLTPAFESLRAHLVPIPAQLQPHVAWVEWAESDDPYGALLAHLSTTTAIVLDAQVRTLISVGMRSYGGRIDGVVQSSPLTIDAQVEATVRQKVALIRERKDAREVGLLRCANQTRSRLHFGITESETRGILEEEMAAAGLTGGDGLVLFGENAALPHGSGTDRKLGKQDLVLIDAGGKWGGYVSDITRTFALPGSKIPSSDIAVWDTVRRAQLAPSLLLATRNTSSPPLLADLDVAARAIVSAHVPKSGSSSSAAGSIDYSVFTHRLGHGIGLEGHESPYVVQGPLGMRPVLAGYVVSQEPGAYMPARRGTRGVGVRLEDCFVVTETDGQLGGEWLTGPVGKWGDV